MAVTLNATQAKNKFGELLDRVQHGEEIIITRRGRPAIRLVPAEEETLSPDYRPLTEEEWAQMEREVDEDLRAGRRYGPFAQVEEAIAFLHDRARHTLDTP